MENLFIRTKEDKVIIDSIVEDYNEPYDLIFKTRKMNIAELYSFYLYLKSKNNSPVIKTEEIVYKSYSVEKEIQEFLNKHKLENNEEEED